MKYLFDIASQDPPPDKNKPLLLVKRDQRNTPAEHGVWDCSVWQPSALESQEQVLDFDSKQKKSNLFLKGGERKVKVKIIENMEYHGESEKNWEHWS